MSLPFLSPFLDLKMAISSLLNCLSFYRLLIHFHYQLRLLLIKGNAFNKRVKIIFFSHSDDKKSHGFATRTIAFSVHLPLPVQTFSKNLPDCRFKHLGQSLLCQGTTLSEYHFSSLSLPQSLLCLYNAGIIIPLIPQVYLVAHHNHHR